MAEDVKLEMTGAGAILQSNFLFPGWIKPELYILGELRDNTAPVGWRKN